MIIIKEYFNPVDLDIDKDKLDKAGIPYMTTDVFFNTAMPDVHSGIKLLVPEDDEARARNILYKEERVSPIQNNNWNLNLVEDHLRLKQQLDLNFVEDRSLHEEDSTIPLSDMPDPQKKENRVKINKITGRYPCPCP